MMSVLQFICLAVRRTASAWFPVSTDRAFRLGKEWGAGIAKISAAVLLAGALTSEVSAQEPVASDLYRERPRNEGNRIAFCLRPLGKLAGFEKEIADAIGQVLLTEVRIHVVQPQNFPVRPTGYDYLFGLTYEQIFILMAEHCDAILGMALTPQTPDWLRLSRPYLSAPIIGMTVREDVRALSALLPSASIGVQALTPADAALTSYLGTLASDRAPQRVIFRDNRSLANALAEEKLDAALIWEGAALIITQGGSTGQGLHVLDRLPFLLPPVQLGLAVRSGDDFLGAQIDAAIAVLEEDGTLAELAERHGLVRAEVNLP